MTQCQECGTVCPCTNKPTSAIGRPPRILYSGAVERYGLDQMSSTVLTLPNGGWLRIGGREASVDSAESTTRIGWPLRLSIGPDLTSEDRLALRTITSLYIQTHYRGSHNG